MADTAPGLDQRGESRRPGAQRPVGVLHVCEQSLVEGPDAIEGLGGEKDGCPTDAVGLDDAGGAVASVPPVVAAAGSKLAPAYQTRSG